MLNKRRWKRTWWLEGLLLVLVLLGHDVLMASVAHAATLPTPTAATHEHAPVQQPTMVSASNPDDQHPAHPSSCGVAGVALPSPSHQLDVTVLDAIGVITSPERSTAAHAPVHWWDEPFWPPGTFRALLQVYRI